MPKRKYYYQIVVITVSAVFVLIAYMAILKLLDGILIDHDIYVSARAASATPGSIVKHKERLSQQVSDKRAKLEAALSKKEFTQGSIHELAQEFHCRLVQLESRNPVKGSGEIYDVSYAGTVESLLNLLNHLETDYAVAVREVLLTSDNPTGTVVRMKLILALKSHEL